MRRLYASLFFHMIILWKKECESKTDPKIQSETLPFSRLSPDLGLLNSRRPIHLSFPELAFPEHPYATIPEVPVNLFSLSRSAGKSDE
jgi:hypothetical protein